MLYLFVLLLFTPSVNSDGVFGCGGFVKSEVDINFSLVMLKLYTPHGSIKYQTDCAPNTGYYLIPLYDKGDFILKAEPPKGWGFEPSSVELKVDGENDPCSRGEDINFKFTGFSVTGSVVSLGQKTGPSGVKVDLYPAANAKGESLSSTVTQEGGSFVFTDVMPGDYSVVASHPKWKFNKGQVTISLKKDNVDIGSELSIAGFDVKGEVTGDGLPMQNVNFVLFSKTPGKQTALKNCETGAPKGFHTKETKQAPICYTVSQNDGTFVFPEIPSGSYFLVPFYKGEHITFDVEPGRLDFDVAQDSLLLQTKFEVAGFSVSGKVLDKDNGVGIPNVAIFLNGEDLTITGPDGSYQLENMKKGTYRLAAKADNIDFEEMSVAISPNTPQLPNMVASGFSLCGRVVIERVPETLGQIPSQRRIIYFPEGKGNEANSMATNNNGKFCTFVKPGKYVVKVHLSENEVKSGLNLSPIEKSVTVSNKPVLDVVFSQFQAKISGVVKCMEKCQAMDVVLDAVGRSDKQTRIPVRLAGNEATFTFNGVLPGKYKASIIMDLWCWKDKGVEVEVVDNDLSGLEFSHTGYILKISVSHPITINFAHNKQEKSVGAFLLDKGLNRFCLAHPGVYQLTPESCHRFDKDHYSYDTSNPLTLTLTALQHLVLGSVTAEAPISDIKLTIRSSVEDDPTTLGPLKPNTTATAAAKKAAEGKEVTTTVYTFSHWARSGEKLTISAGSADLLFYPPQVEVYVSGEECPGKGAELVGRRGVFVEGNIKPVLEGVKVKVTASDDSMEPVVLVSDSKGKYKLGPLHSDKTYSVIAEKPGYVLTKESPESMSFRAFKLGEISIKVVGEDGQPLPGVLLSLSGEKQFRSNNVTGADGAMSIVGLSPGQYFLRPMMKEYKFTPASQMLVVQEGTTEKMSIQGARVAFSVFGHVTSLNGEPEPGVVIEALGSGTGDCSQYQEESKTETNGAYRIRGLQPSCVYNVQLKMGGEVNTHIERTAPSARVVNVEKADIVDVDIIAFRRMNQMDVTGNVVVDDLKYLSSLKVQLFATAHPDSPIHTVSLSKSTFFFLPSLVMDDRTYLLTLTSSLSKSEYDYRLPTEEFAGNKSHVHVTFEFGAKPRLLDNDLNHGSFFFPVLVLIFAAMAYHHKRVIPYLASLTKQIQGSKLLKTSPGGGGGSGLSFSSLTSSLTSSSMSSPIGAGDIQEVMDHLESSPVKRRAKPRKV